MATNEKQDPAIQAAQWLQVLHEGHPSDADMAAFDAWMNASDAHADAYLSMSEQYYALDFLDPQRVGLGEPVSAETPAHEALTGADNVVAFDGGKPKRRWFRPLAVAASVAALFVFSQVFLSGPTADLSSPVGEVALHTLDDSSTVHLNTDTQVNVSMTAAQRGIELVYGEAYFTVAKDAARPFVVRTNGAQVTALGTEFVVYNRDNGKIQVAVYESRVEVQHPQYLQQPLVVGAGEMLEFGPDVDRAVVSQLRTQGMPGWREGRLVFNNTPLEDVIAVLNDYHTGRILLSEKLGSLPVSGVFHGIESVRILNDIIETQALASLRISDRVIYVYR